MIMVYYYIWFTAAWKHVFFYADNLNLSLAKKISVLFNKLQNYDSNLIFQELWKYNFKTGVIPKTIEKNMSFTVDQFKKDAINPGLPLFLIDRIIF